MLVSTGLYYNLIIILICKPRLTSIIFCSQFQRKKRQRGKCGERGEERERLGKRERETETEHLHELYGVSVMLDPRGLVGAWVPDV